MGFVEQVRSRSNPECIVLKMRKEGCGVSLGGAPRKRLIIDFDKPGAPVCGNGPNCDYLFVAEGDRGEVGWVTPLELKKGALQASGIVRQLRAGAEAAERLIPDRFQPLFRPVAVYGGSAHKQQRAALRERRNHIAFRGRVEAIRLMNCGDRLAKVLG